MSSLLFCSGVAVVEEHTFLIISSEFILNNLLSNLIQKLYISFAFRLLISEKCSLILFTSVNFLRSLLPLILMSFHNFSATTYVSILPTEGTSCNLRIHVFNCSLFSQPLYGINILLSNVRTSHPIEISFVI